MASVLAELAEACVVEPQAHAACVSSSSAAHSPYEAPHEEPSSPFRSDSFGDLDLPLSDPGASLLALTTSAPSAPPVPPALATLVPRASPMGSVPGPFRPPVSVRRRGSLELLRQLPSVGATAHHAATSLGFRLAALSDVEGTATTGSSRSASTTGSEMPAGGVSSSSSSNAMPCHPAPELATVPSRPSCQLPEPRGRFGLTPVHSPRGSVSSMVGDDSASDIRVSYLASGCADAPSPAVDAGPLSGSGRRLHSLRPEAQASQHVFQPQPPGFRRYSVDPYVEFSHSSPPGSAGRRVSLGLAAGLAGQGPLTAAAINFLRASLDQLQPQPQGQAGPYQAPPGPAAPRTRQPVHSRHNLPSLNLAALSTLGPRPESVGRVRDLGSNASGGGGGSSGGGGGGGDGAPSPGAPSSLGALPRLTRLAGGEDGSSLAPPRAAPSLGPGSDEAVMVGGTAGRGSGYCGAVAGVEVLRQPIPPCGGSGGGGAAFRANRPTPPTTTRPQPAPPVSNALTPRDLQLDFGPRSGSGTGSGSGSDAAK
ncbi:hypothetical protein HYH03_011124 [Edaphochlamys debaryana]|uniref:Uncharacterized protein n=1 Tax=Edaphochlamys debaryana TaxID=47281 RepID=A0A835XSP8_9CHLO|nr:hypothetical protein HYH03_011124 [Edaphochlamys debaryana]|eukprot:KAG2490502.1 hypothetical protein HYH03_011124 [Edaphochlamys debaryana]